MTSTWLAGVCRNSSMYIWGIYWCANEILYYKKQQTTHSKTKYFTFAKFNFCLKLQYELKYAKVVVVLMVNEEIIGEKSMYIDRRFATQSKHLKSCTGILSFYLQ